MNAALTRGKHAPPLRCATTVLRPSWPKESPEIILTQTDTLYFKGIPDNFFSYVVFLKNLLKFNIKKLNMKRSWFPTWFFVCFEQHSTI